MLPCRYILINQQAFKGVLDLDIVPINDVLVLHIRIHQFKGALTDSIIQSFDVNSSNRAFFTALPIERIGLQEISFNQAEDLFLWLQNMLNNIQMDERLHEVRIFNLNLYLSYDQIFKMSNFISQFVQSYELIRLQFTQSQTNTEPSVIANTTQLVNVSEPDTIEPQEEASVEVENPDGSDEIAILNDCLLMSPNTLVTYFISKQISGVLNQAKKEKIHFEFNKDTVTIHMSPLIQQELIEISNDHYTDLINLLSSFNYSQEEYITKLKFLVRHLIYIITHYTPTNNSYFITVKIINFLLLLYSLKLSPTSIMDRLSVDRNSVGVQIFKNTIEHVINYAIGHVIQSHIDPRQLSHKSISFKHYPSIEYFEEELKSEEIRQLISKELYLLEVDKEFFTKQIIKRSDREGEQVDANNFKLTFNKPININIIDILSKPPLENNSWLDYKSITPQQKQFETHKIITNDYLQLLQLTNIPNISQSLLKDIHPILAKYSNIIINQIFKELSVCDSKHTISTLYLLTTYVRPYLHRESSIKTEMYILYRIVIPHLYDVYNVTLFTDYFH